MPRSGNRTWACHGNDRIQLDHASMRPGQSCPGVGLDVRHRDRDCYLHTRFNEAGAIMPRSGPPMLEPIRALKSLSACFNEAGAIMPRSGAGSASLARRSTRLLQ